MATEKKKKNIIIVGGGTAGWLSATFLSRLLEKNNNDDYQITLVEASDIKTVGVGEATIPTLATTISFLDFDESEWMPACNATYKMAV